MGTAITPLHVHHLHPSVEGRTPQFQLDLLANTLDGAIDASTLLTTLYCRLLLPRTRLITAACVDLSSSTLRLRQLPSPSIPSHCTLLPRRYRSIWPQLQAFPNRFP